MRGYGELKAIGLVKESHGAHVDAPQQLIHLSMSNPLDMTQKCRAYPGTRAR